ISLLNMFYTPVLTPFFLEPLCLLIGFSGPFGATQLWHNIIQALQTQVEVRRCRRHLRVHAECFTGSDAVDAVLSYLMQNVVFCTSEVSRLKAARLCQALMEAKVFEPVGTKLFRRDKEVVFEDSSCSLYRFLEYKALAGSSMKEWHSTDTENMSSEEVEIKRKKMVDEVWKQQTLLQLLQIVELPMLDCILTSPARVQTQACRAPLSTQDLVISNTCLERELPDSLNLPQLDAWLSAAADCLELFPDQLIVVAGEQLSQKGSNTSVEDGNAEQMASQKRLLFDTISKYYSGQEKASLLSGRYLDIHAAILNLLGENGGKVQDAIRASQLCLRLLETSVRDELRRLLAFMATAAHPDASRLQKQIDNRALVCRTFQRAIVQNHELTRSQCETLVLFLMDNHTELFKVHIYLHQKLITSLTSVHLCSHHSPSLLCFAAFTFCQQVTPQEYEDQREATTLESLKQLLHDISSSKSMPVKERRRLLKEFEKHHPVVFLQHFSSTF
uniref:DEP domain-containing protein n=1 Tax=Lates calcarifer TaxID=8187 RepID=A0A4W6E6W9_LATCA